MEGVQQFCRARAKIEEAERAFMEEEKAASRRSATYRSLLFEEMERRGLDKGRAVVDGETVQVELKFPPDPKGFSADAILEAVRTLLPSVAFDAAGVASLSSLAYASLKQGGRRRRPTLRVTKGRGGEEPPPLENGGAWLAAKQDLKAIRGRKQEVTRAWKEESKGLEEAVEASLRLTDPEKLMQKVCIRTGEENSTYYVRCVEKRTTCRVGILGVRSLLERVVGKVVGEGLTDEATFLARVEACIGEEMGQEKEERRVVLQRGAPRERRTPG